MTRSRLNEKLTRFETKVWEQLIKNGNNAAWAHNAVKNELDSVMIARGWDLSVKEYAEIIEAAAKIAESV